MDSKVTSEFQAKLDKNHYAVKDLILLKVPLALPYVDGSVNFEKTDGTIVIKGIIYQYVKKRIYKDTLEVLCLPNYARTAIQKARDQITKMAYDFDNLNNSKKPVSPLSHKIKHSSLDFTNDHLNPNNYNWDFDRLRYNSLIVPSLVSILLQGIDHPPEGRIA